MAVTIAETGGHVTETALKTPLSPPVTMRRNDRSHSPKYAAVPLVKLDLKKFYPSVDGARVSRFFTGTMRCSPDVAALLTRLCTFDNHVPTGSCVSQLLAFFAAKPLFDELHDLAASAGVRDSCYVDDLTWSGYGATPAFLWAVKQVVHRHGFKYHKDRCFAAGDRKLVTGVMLDGTRIAVLPSKEFDLWKNTQALGDFQPQERIVAVNSLIGSAVAAGQIEARFLRRLLRLRQVKATAIAEAKLPYDSASRNENMTMASAPAPIPANPQPIEQVPVRIEVPSKPKY